MRSVLSVVIIWLRGEVNGDENLLVVVIILSVNILRKREKGKKAKMIL